MVIAVSTPQPQAERQSITSSVLLLSAAAVLITTKLAVLSEVMTLGQSSSPFLRNDTGNSSRKIILFV